ncbi:unnamed protein product [Oikopleura dioica]|uniref:Uncharacterized protein n=1 Tax=Oikopleura dioica TaxID=34765 RepID=E4YZQ4_OIKDI|nr:unnamed protein product [Oikopleura dioica]
MRHKNPPMAVSSCDSDTEDSDAASLVFDGHENPLIGPMEDPRKTDDNERYQTFMIDPISRKRTSNIHKLDDYQWSRYQKRLLGTYLDRITAVGTEEEVYMCSLMYPGAFLKHAACLVGKTDSEVRQVIGPHSEKKHREFNSNFGIADRRWQDLARHLIIPNTCEEDWGTDRDNYDPQPEDIRAQAAHDYIRSLAVGAIPTLPLLPDIPEQEHEPPLIYDLQLASNAAIDASDAPEQDSIDCSDYPYERQAHDERVREETSQRLQEYESQWMQYYGKRFAEDHAYSNSGQASRSASGQSSPVILVEEESRFFATDFAFDGYYHFARR